MTVSPVDVNALVLEAVDQPMKVETLRLDAPQQGQVRVRLRASGVCHSDLHTRDGGWAAGLPLVLGHEGAGVVESLGDGVDGLSVGDHVILAWVAPCGRCRMCATGRGWACHQGNDFSFDADRAPLHRDGDGVDQYLGLGTFADCVVVPRTAVVPIAKAIPFDVAALIGCAVTTGAGAVFHNAKVAAGSSVAVVGCGGVGLSIVMAARIAGAYPIIAIDVTDEKLERARTLGATHIVQGGTSEQTDSRVRDIVPSGVEYSFDAVGHPATMNTALTILAMAGTAVLVGMPSEGVTLEIDPLTISAMGQTIVGSNYGATVPLSDFPRLGELYLAGMLPVEELISHRIKLDQVEEAFAEMRAGRRARSVIVYD